jgi:phage-related protein
MAVFTFAPDFDANEGHEPRVRKTQFADGGYEHRIRFGLNTDPKTYDLTFANRTDSEADQIVQFFKDAAGAEAFDWTSSVEATRNLLTYTDDITQSIWSKSQITSIATNLIGYAGGSNASGIVANTTNAEHFIQQQFTVAASTNTTHSIYVKQNVGRDVLFTVYGPTAGQTIGVSLNFSTSTGSLINSGVAVTDWGAARVGSDGWWRLWVTGRPDNSTTRTVRITTTSATGATTYSGDGSTARLQIMGPQVEYGSLTGYQPIAAAEPTKKWVCERWNRRYLNCNNNTVTATFRQVYEA